MIRRSGSGPGRTEDIIVPSAKEVDGHSTLDSCTDDRMNVTVVLQSKVFLDPYCRRSSDGCLLAKRQSHRV